MQANHKSKRFQRELLSYVPIDLYFWDKKEWKNIIGRQFWLNNYVEVNDLPKTIFSNLKSVVKCCLSLKKYSDPIQNISIRTEHRWHKN